MSRNQTVAVCANPSCNKSKKIRARGLCYTCYNKQSSSNKKYEKSDKGKQRQVRYREKRCLNDHRPYVKKETTVVTTPSTTEAPRKPSKTTEICSTTIPSCAYLPSLVGAPNYYCEEPLYSDYMTSRFSPQNFMNSKIKSEEAIQKEFEIAQFMQYLGAQPNETNPLLNVYKFL